GQARAIDIVFNAIHDGNPDERLLSYQYLQVLPQIAQGSANKLWIIPSEFTKALEGLSNVFPAMGGKTAPSGGAASSSSASGSASVPARPSIAGTARRPAAPGDEGGRHTGEYGTPTS
ncbi:MAG: hypothetical protein ACRDPW_06580, partial [Mycobacteriales bacterium]